ncbi:hypothetical protein H8D36_01915 [archaeon]|nr:hypothetical protein [archaeon]MBL7057543.1 hypothetical protein [Candidatus Woesearchaeota archaeon]
MLRKLQKYLTFELLKSRRSQAAVEFLITYGWAIIVVLATIGAMAYFGVLDMSSFMPSRCTFPVAVTCIDDASINADTDQILFIVQNSYHAQINLTGGSVTSDECSNAQLLFCSGPPCTPTNPNIQLLNNEQATVAINCQGGLTSGRLSADVMINYLDSQTNLVLRTPGQIRGTSIN